LQTELSEMQHKNSETQTSQSKSRCKWA